MPTRQDGKVEKNSSTLARLTRLRITTAPSTSTLGGGHGVGAATGIGAGHGMSGVTGTHSMGMVGHPMGVAPQVGARSFAAMPMSRAAFAPAFSRAAFTHHPAFFHHHHNRFNRFAFVGGGDYFYAGYDDCWRRVWTAYGPQWVNICDYYNYGY